ncbi:MAG: TraV family lipoprotein [Desulfobulbaceae bacterium]|nr:TraV family lipoprotein [Desulfobulbaceae bacterium]
MKPFNKIVRNSPFILLMLLSGCGPVLNPYNENFKCRATDDEGKCIDTPTAYEEARYPEALPENSGPAAETQQAIQDNRYRILAELLQEPKKPLLQPPKVLRVLLLPYRGEDDELFMTRYVYLKIEDAKWVLTDLDEK